MMLQLHSHHHHTPAPSQRRQNQQQQPRHAHARCRQGRPTTARQQPQAWRDGAHSSSGGRDDSSTQQRVGAVSPLAQPQPQLQPPLPPQQQQPHSNGYASASLQGGPQEEQPSSQQQQQVQQPFGSSSSSLQQPFAPQPPQQQPQQPPPQPPQQQPQQPPQEQQSSASVLQQQQQPQQQQEEDAAVSALSSQADPPAAVTTPSSSGWQPWPPDVPWGLDTVVGVLSLWLLAYVAIGQLLVPSVLGCLDLERAAMSARELALLNLCVDCFQAALTLLMLAKCLGRYRPRTRGLFPLRWQRGVWLTWVAAGVGCFPVIDWVWKRGTSLLLGTEVQLDDMFHTQIELGLYTGDVITIGCYVIIVGVLAPLWEEVLFRGFLLPSLAKLVTPWPAVTLTALLFAWMHSSSEAIVPLLLVALGCGALLVRFDNLLPPILLHGLYNLYVFANMAVQLYCGCGPVVASLSVAFGASGVLLLAALAVRWRQQSGQGGGDEKSGGASSEPPPAAAA